MVVICAVASYCEDVMFQRKLGFCALSLPGLVFCHLRGTFCRCPRGDDGAGSTAVTFGGCSGPRPSAVQLLPVVPGLWGSLSPTPPSPPSAAACILSTPLASHQC